MTPVPSEVELINLILDLQLDQALSFLVNAGITVVAFKKGIYNKVRQAIINKCNEKRYAFIPNKEEADKLKELSKDPNYTTLRRLIPGYRYLDLIRTGLLIKKYLQRNALGDHDRVNEIKRDINNRPNGQKLLKIVKLPDAPFFDVITDEIFYLQKEGYNQTQLEEKFDEVVNDWEDTTKFVKTGDKLKTVINFCVKHINKDVKQFFLLGMKTAIDIIEKAISEMTSKSILKDNNYSLRKTTKPKGVQPRMEVTFYKKYE